jgi:hypothetical protein
MGQDWKVKSWYPSDECIDDAEGCDELQQENARANEDIFPNGSSYHGGGCESSERIEE